jgi:hypothetical protein
MISEATVDCYNHSEQSIGLFNMIEEKLCLPFSTIVLGMPVSVDTIELNDAAEIVAVCSIGSEKQRITLLDLSLHSPRPEGADWIAAYRRWASGR